MYYPSWITHLLKRLIFENNQRRSNCLTLWRARAVLEGDVETEAILSGTAAETDHTLLTPDVSVARLVGIQLEIITTGTVVL